MDTNLQLTEDNKDLTEEQLNDLENGTVGTEQDLKA